MVLLLYLKYLALEEESKIESNSMMANKTSPWRIAGLIVPSFPVPRSQPGTRKVEGRNGMIWEEEDWVDENATGHRELDES